MAFERDITIGPCRLIQGDMRAVLPQLEPVDHIIFDPPYENSLHEAKAKASQLRVDGGSELKALDFEGVDGIRGEIVDLCLPLCRGWFAPFCTIEGTKSWADEINPRDGIKYKRACIWVKPDSAPQMNGQGPAAGAEAFIVAWAGGGHSKWSAGGKRGVYTHQVNPPDRHGGHPTEKPWRLFREIIWDFTFADQCILDPCMGSGTTLVAATRTGRQAIGIEKDPKYFEMAVQRVAAAFAGVRAAKPQLAEQKQLKMPIGVSEAAYQEAMEL